MIINKLTTKIIKTFNPYYTSIIRHTFIQTKSNNQLIKMQKSNRDKIFKQNKFQSKFIMKILDDIKKVNIRQYNSNKYQQKFMMQQILDLLNLNFKHIYTQLGQYQQKHKFYKNLLNLFKKAHFFSLNLNQIFQNVFFLKILSSSKFFSKQIALALAYKTIVVQNQQDFLEILLIYDINCNFMKQYISHKGDNLVKIEKMLMDKIIEYNGTSLKSYFNITNVYKLITKKHEIQVTILNNLLKIILKNEQWIMYLPEIKLIIQSNHYRLNQITQNILYLIVKKYIKQDVQYYFSIKKIIQFITKSGYQLQFLKSKINKSFSKIKDKPLIIIDLLIWSGSSIQTYVPLPTHQNLINNLFLLENVIKDHIGIDKEQIIKYQNSYMIYNQSSLINLIQSMVENNCLNLQQLKKIMRKKPNQFMKTQHLQNQIKNLIQFLLKKNTLQTKLIILRVVHMFRITYDYRTLQSQLLSNLDLLSIKQTKQFLMFLVIKNEISLLLSLETYILNALRDPSMVDVGLEYLQYILNTNAINKNVRYINKFEELIKNHILNLNVKINIECLSKYLIQLMKIKQLDPNYQIIYFQRLQKQISHYQIKHITTIIRLISYFSNPQLINSKQFKQLKALYQKKAMNLTLKIQDHSKIYHEYLCTDQFNISKQLELFCRNRIIQDLQYLNTNKDRSSISNMLWCIGMDDKNISKYIYENNKTFINKLLNECIQNLKKDKTNIIILNQISQFLFEINELSKEQIKMIQDLRIESGFIRHGILEALILKYIKQKNRYRIETSKKIFPYIYDILIDQKIIFQINGYHHKFKNKIDRKRKQLAEQQGYKYVQIKSNESFQHIVDHHLKQL